VIDAHREVDQATLVSMLLEQHAQPVGRLKTIGNWLKRNIHVGGRYGL